MTSRKPFLLEPRNQAFLAGETHHLVGSPTVGCLLVPVMIAAFALAGIWGAHYQRQRLQTFEQNKVAAQGRILSRRVSSSVSITDLETGVIHSDEDYLVTYQFDIPVPGGQRTWEREVAVSERDYAGLRPGMVVRVSYDREDPSYSRLDCEGQPTGPLVLGALGISLLVFAILAGVLLVMLWWRSRCLALYGQELHGQVVTCTSTKDENNGVHVQLTYRFASPSGRQITDIATASRADLTEATLPTPQTALVMLYCSDSNYKLL